MPALNSKEINRHLKTIPNGSKRVQTIARTFKFEGIPKGITFVNHVAKEARKANHHPDIDIRFDKATLNLTTHKEGGLTGKDFSLARRYEEIFAKFSGS